MFNISISNKITKGFIRNEHDVINFSYRNYANRSFLKNKNKNLNDKIISIVDNYRPNLIVLGHNNFLTTDNLHKIKKIMTLNLVFGMKMH